MKNVLITGGAGFIGTNLCRHLRDLGSQVTSLDNYFTGCKTNHLDGVTYLEGNTKNIDKIVNIEPDIVYHLGEYSRVEQSFSDFHQLQDFNMTGTRAVVDYCARNKAKLIYAGSSTKFAAKSENYVEAPYTWTKRTNTDYINKYAEWFGLNYAIVYFYNVYGRNEISAGKYATLIGRYTAQMRDNEPLTIVAPGTQQRNFTHVDDIVTGLEIVGSHGEGDLFGIGSEQKFSVQQVANMFGGQQSLLPERPGNRIDADLNIQRTKELGWKSQIQLPQYVKQLKINNWISF